LFVNKYDGRRETHSSWLCVDANLVIRLVADPGDESVRQLWEQWDAARRQLAAPTRLHCEVTNALHRYQKLGSTIASSARLAPKAAVPTNQLFPPHFSLHSRSHQSIVSTTVFPAQQLPPINCFH